MARPCSEQRGGSSLPGEVRLRRWSGETSVDSQLDLAPNRQAGGNDLTAPVVVADRVDVRSRANTLGATVAPASRQIRASARSTGPPLALSRPEWGSKGELWLGGARAVTTRAACGPTYNPATPKQHQSISRKGFRQQAGIYCGHCASKQSDQYNQLETFRGCLLRRDTRCRLKINDTL